MKKNAFTLTIKLLLLLIPVIILSVYCAVTPLSYMPAEYAMWQQEKDYVGGRLDSSDKEAEDPDILILGDSRAKSGIIPEQLRTDKSVYNMAIGGATPVEMYFALEKYLDNHDAPEQIIMIFAPYHFCQLDNWGQTMSFNYLDTADYIEVYRNAYRFGEADKLSAAKLFDVISYKLYLPNKTMAHLYDAHFFGNKEANMQRYADLCDNRGYTAFGTNDGDDGLNYDTHFDWFDDSKLIGFYFDKLLALCHDNNIELTYVQSPINEASAEVIRGEFVHGYNSVTFRALDKYGYEYKKERLPVYDNAYFGDANHLNYEGAKKFTGEISDSLFGND